MIKHYSAKPPCLCFPKRSNSSWGFPFTFILSLAKFVLEQWMYVLSHNNNENAEIKRKLFGGLIWLFKSGIITWACSADYLDQWFSTHVTSEPTLVLGHYVTTQVALQWNAQHCSVELLIVHSVDTTQVQAPLQDMWRSCKKCMYAWSSLVAITQPSLSHLKLTIVPDTKHILNSWLA